jgi:hypothetical protein
LKSITGPEMCRLIEANGWSLRRISEGLHAAGALEVQAQLKREAPKPASPGLFDAPNV